MTPASSTTATHLDSSTTHPIMIVLDPDVSIMDQLRVEKLPVHASDICLDFARLESMNSAELGAMIRFLLDVKRQFTNVSLGNVGPHLEEIFEITRLRRVITA